MDCIPLVMPVSLYDLVYKTLNFFQTALLTGGVAANAITGTGTPWSVDLNGFVAYLIMAIVDWFAPWSLCGQQFYVSNSAIVGGLMCSGGNLVPNTWAGKTMPAPLALNLAMLYPCCDLKNRRVYYPCLKLDCIATSFAIANYTVFAAQGTGGLLSFSNYQYNTFTETLGNVTALLNKYSNFAPVKTMPKIAHRVNLACYMQMPYAGVNGTGVGQLALHSTRPATQDVKDIMTSFAMPFIQADSVLVYGEYFRMLTPRFITMCPAARNADYSTDKTSYYQFIINSNNALSVGAKSLLDSYDTAQRDKSSSFGGWFGSIGSFVSGAAASSYGIPALASAATYVGGQIVQADMGRRMLNRM